MGNDDGRVAIQAQGIGLADQDAGECPSIRGVIVVHEEIDDEDHGLNDLQGRTTQVGEHSECLVRRRDFFPSGQDRSH